MASAEGGEAARVDGPGNWKVDWVWDRGSVSLKGPSTVWAEREGGATHPRESLEDLSARQLPQVSTLETSG